MKYNRSFDLSKISTYRSEIFGFAIISVILTHFFDDWYFAWHSGLPGTESTLMRVLTTVELGAIGSMGVDIFLILSGAGLYYSFSKDCNLRRFFNKRFSRVLIPYIPVAIIFWAVKDFILMDESFARFAGDVTFVTFFTDGTRTIWYAGFIIAMYIIFPIIYGLMYDSDGKPKKYAWAVLLVAYAIPATIYFFSADFYQKTEIAITRIPSFTAGVFFGYYMKQGRKVPASFAILFCIVGVCGGIASLLVDMPDFLSKYLDGFYACAALIVLTVLFDIIKNCNYIGMFFRCFGKYTFELYIIHVTLRNLMKSTGIETYMASQYITMIAISFALSILLKKCSYTVRKIQ